MQINPVKQNCFYSSFGLKKQKKEEEKTSLIPTEDEIRTAKVKKTVSECTCIATGVSIIYFAMKKNFKENRLKALKNKAEKLAKIKAPKAVLIDPELLKKFL